MGKVRTRWSIIPKQYIDPTCRRIVGIVIGVIEHRTNIERSWVLQVLGSAMFDEPIRQLRPVLTTGIRAYKLLEEKMSRAMMKIVLTANNKDRREIERIMLFVDIALRSTVYCLCLSRLQASKTQPVSCAVRRVSGLFQHNSWLLHFNYTDTDKVIEATTQLKMSYNL